MLREYRGIFESRLEKERQSKSWRFADSQFFSVTTVKVTCKRCRENPALLSERQGAGKSFAAITKEMYVRENTLSFTQPVMELSLTFIPRERGVGALSHS